MQQEAVTIREILISSPLGIALREQPPAAAV